MSSPTLEATLRARARAVRRNIGGQYVFDAASWSASLAFAAVFRYEFALRNVFVPSIVILCVVAMALQFALGRWGFNLYRGRYRIGSFHEVRALAVTVATTALIIAIPVLVAGTLFKIPRSTVLVALPMALVLMGGARYMRRLLWERKLKPTDAAENTLVYGAGDLANFVIPQMLTTRTSRYLPVGLIDDSPAKSNFSISGVPVLGPGSQLQKIARDCEATTLIVCIGRADSTLIRKIKDQADEAGLRMLVFPLLSDILDGKSGLKDLKEVSIEDLIGRNPVDTDVESIADYLTGKRVLVTGAGGSIGSVLSQQIAKFSPAELMMLDRDESGLQSSQLSVDGHGLLDTKNVILADIRDRDTLLRIFADRRPEVVFHAAALKHLPMLEQYPEEAWQTNVLGTLNVLDAARSVGVVTFVNISTDKAANPTSVLGHSKRVAEKLTSWAAEETGRRYLSVRFGNVIGSRGSMLPTFSSLIAAGGPLTVTHPDVTRFFMTIPEACQLVVQAGGIGEPGEVLILDMGEPVRILDVARRMIEMSGKDVEIVFTGLRPGEKLHEELLGENESDARPRHPKISHARVEALAPDHLDRAEWLRRCGVKLP
ncbi:polysaccharide biosynthesis protein [Salinibacterium sp. dk2585]|uniref:polysaccharide biosynthesis protein n=1 Tax=unclassified Salinibacterium TaxID=2632331 RepID=UPI0011C25151|nr:MULTISPECIES: nucleoside-diphosphate sugar epimerase/dehydratase [unclassified Salinibacterium]QEE60847.1 polysaccharide biosynthesis protein [Salinibacterium sp. dk2585]TXK55919.1 polysaccharide biosynthesis protein [Salinibacterium sp. dk5596]